jgi:beta-glucosidase
LDDWDLDTAKKVASEADVAFVFSNADSGEGYIEVDGNLGDRKNLTLWHNGDELVKILYQLINSFTNITIIPD